MLRVQPAQQSTGRKVHRYLIPNQFLTTVDSSGVRTKVDLQEYQSAVLKRIPVSVRTDHPVNLAAVEYDAKGVKLVLNGSGQVEIALRDGDFLILPNTSYTVRNASVVRANSDAGGGRLTFPMSLHGQTQVLIEE